MSRTYALALIFAAVTLVSGLFYAQYRYLTGRQVEVVAYAAEVHERVVAGQLAEMERMDHMAQERMQDDTKYRFRPILPFVSKAFERRDAYLSRVKEDKDGSDYDLATFSRFHDSELDSLAVAYTTFLRGHGGDMDLNLEDINAKVAHIGKILDEIRSASNDDFHSNSEAPLVQELLMLDYLEVVGKVVHDAIEISGGKVIGCFFGPEFFPIMVTDVENPRKGETVNAKVWAGSFFTSNTIEDIVILVNRDTLKINPNGTADYTFTPAQRGKFEVDLELCLINRLTGKVVKSQGKRAFNIR